MNPLLKVALVKIGAASHYKSGSAKALPSVLASVLVKRASWYDLLLAAPLGSDGLDKLSGLRSKISFDAEQARKVLAVGKKMKLPKASIKATPSVAAGGFGALPSYSRFAREMKALPGKLISYGLPERAAQATTRQLAGAGGTGIVRRLKRPAIVGSPSKVQSFLRTNPVAKMTGLRNVGNEMAALDPANKKMVNSVFTGHEVAEATTPARLGFTHMGHRSPEVMLQEHNMIATLPREFAPAKRVMQGIRAPSEAPVLRSIGIEYGQSPRVSRHARKHLTNILERRMEAQTRAQIQAAKNMGHFDKVSGLRSSHALPGVLASVLIKRAAWTPHLFRAVAGVTPVVNRIASNAPAGPGGIAGAALGEVMQGTGSLLKNIGMRKRVSAGLSTTKGLRPGALPPPKGISGPGSSLIRAGKAMEFVAPLAKIGKYGHALPGVLAAVLVKRASWFPVPSKDKGIIAKIVRGTPLTPPRSAPPVRGPTISERGGRVLSEQEAFLAQMNANPALSFRSGVPGHTVTATTPSPIKSGLTPLPSRPKMPANPRYNSMNASGTVSDTVATPPGKLKALIHQQTRGVGSPPPPLPSRYDLVYDL